MGKPNNPPISPFLAAGCGGCHALADAGATGASASNLDIAQPSYDTVAEVVTNGITNSLGTLLAPVDQQAMPAYNTKLSTQEIQELSSYVSTATGGGDGSTQPPGRQTVLRLGCGFCHALSDVDGKGNSWSSLDIAKPAKATVKAVVDKGIKNRYWGHADWDDLVMPAYDGTLTEQEIKDVGNYISTVTQGGYAQPAGRQAFLKGGCGSCHTFADAGAKGHLLHGLQRNQAHQSDDRSSHGHGKRRPPRQHDAQIPVPRRAKRSDLHGGS